MPCGLRLFAELSGADSGLSQDLDLSQHSLLHAVPQLPKTSLTSFLSHDGTEPLSLKPSRPSRAKFPTAFAHTPGVKCNFDDMKMCKKKVLGIRVPCPELPASWAAEGKTLTDYYADQGLEEPKWFSYWWPGKAGKGECNDLLNRNRGCWYKTRLLQNKNCGEAEHCLAVAPQDGDKSHNLSCPSWIRNEDGERCEVPEGWEACPQKFTIKRQLTRQQLELQQKNLDPDHTPIMSVPDRFFTATMTPCQHAVDPGAECLDPGLTEPKDHEALKHTGMYFDLGMNTWYRCTPWMQCEKYPIKEIYDPQLTRGKCGEEQCREGEDCFVHEDFGTKKVTNKCMPHWNTFLISDSSGILDGPSVSAAGGMMTG